MNYDFYNENDDGICKYITVKQYVDNLTNSDVAIINYNIRSANSKNLDSFSHAFLYSKRPNVLVLTETWCSNDSTPIIPGYYGYHVTRDGRSGGVSVFIDENYVSNCVQNLSFCNSTIEVCTVDISVNDLNFTIIAIYRPHSDSIQNFCDFFSVFLNNSYFRNKFCIVLGDLNICLLKNERPNIEFMNILYSHNFLSLINRPTRFPQTDNITPSLLDHIFMNKQHLHTCGLIDYDQSDHLPTYLNLKMEQPINSKRRIQFRVVNDATKLSFATCVEDFDWNSIISDDVDSYVENFLNALDRIYCSSFPLKTKVISERYYLNRWMTPEMHNLLNAKSNYFSLYRLGRSLDIELVSRDENNRFKNRVTNLIRIQKKKYYRDLINNCKNDLRKTWKIINSLMSKGFKNTSIRKIVSNDIVYSNEEDISKIFNDYFCNIGTRLSSNIPISPSDPLQYVEFNNVSCFHLYAVSSSEIVEIIKSLKNSKNDMNSFSVALLKEYSNFFSPIIASIVNLCFRSGKFPYCLKKAVVAPLFKKGNAMNVENYRPISKLHFLSKIIEKTIKVRLISFFSKTNLLSKCQFGFKEGFSTQDAILNVVEQLYENLNDNLISIGVFIDFSKAFDTINHEILLHKLMAYGIKGIAYQLFESYLENRRQAVKIGNSCSSVARVNLGVPQGSVLGPILYLLYVDEIPRISSNFSTCLFADDTSLLFRSSNFDEIFTLCNHELNRFYEWCCSNRLSINVSKTKFMIFSNRKVSNVRSIELHNEPLEHVSSVRFLGVELDENLKFNLHINNISQKISKNTGMIRKIKEFIPNDTLINLYHSLVEPYLYYCSLIFGGAFQSHINTLEVAQRKCVRVVGNQPYNAHSNPIFCRLKLLKMHDIYKFNLGVYVNKNMSFFNNNVRTNFHNTRSSNELIPAFQRLTLTQRQSLKYQGPVNWNSIPDEVKNSPSLESFKKRYKCLLLSNYDE